MTKEPNGRTGSGEGKKCKKDCRVCEERIAEFQVHICLDCHPGEPVNRAPSPTPSVEEEKHCDKCRYFNHPVKSDGLYCTNTKCECHTSHDESEKKCIHGGNPSCVHCTMQKAPEKEALSDMRLEDKIVPQDKKCSECGFVRWSDKPYHSFDCSKNADFNSAPQDIDLSICGRDLIRHGRYWSCLRRIGHEGECTNRPDDPTSPRFTADSKEPRDEKGDTRCDCKLCGGTCKTKACNYCQHTPPSTEENNWEEELRLKVRFDRNQDREVCILFIQRLLATEREKALKEEGMTYNFAYNMGRTEAINQIKNIIKNKKESGK